MRTPCSFGIRSDPGLPAPGLLKDAATGLQDLDLTLHLVSDSIVDVAEAIDVLKLHLGPQLAAAPGADANVGLAAHIALFHVGAAGPDIAEDLL